MGLEESDQECGRKESGDRQDDKGTSWRQRHLSNV